MHNIGRTIDLDRKSIGHNAVMVAEVLQYLDIKDNGIYIDATFGSGQHTRSILGQANSIVYAIDRDDSVKSYADLVKIAYNDRFQFIRSNFSNIRSAVIEMYSSVNRHIIACDEENPVTKFPSYINHFKINDSKEDINNSQEDINNVDSINNVDGILFDFGMSSMQIDNPARGFSFNECGPLDMRMSSYDNNAMMAIDVVNNYSQDMLTSIIQNYGGEKKAYKIASAIVLHRKQNKITTTKQLSDIVLNAIGGRGKYHDSIHPATRTFQAIRIEVNDEMKAIEIGVKEALTLLKPGGVICTISFHSLEDSIVKQVFKLATMKMNKTFNECNDTSDDKCVTNTLSRTCSDIDDVSEISKNKINNEIPNKKVHFYKRQDMFYQNFRYLHKGVITPSRQEIKSNRRSRSAKLRAIQKLL